MQSRILRLLALPTLVGCATAPAPLPPVAAPSTPTASRASDPPGKPAWPTASDCRSLAATLAQLAPSQRVGLDPAAAPIAIAVHGVDTSPAPVGIAGDLRLPADDGIHRCTLVVELQPSVRAAPRRVVGHQRIRSTYRAGGAGRANPEYRRLRAELRAVEQDEPPGILATGDPGLDLIGLVADGVLGGIGSALDAGRANALRERLATTPARLDDAVWEPYSFEVTTVEAARRGPVRAHLLDRATGEAWLLEETVQERTRFRVAHGRRARDRGLLEGGGDGLVDLGAVAAWEQAGARPDLTTLLASLAERGSPAAGLAIAPAADHHSQVVTETGADGVRRFRLRGIEPTVTIGGGP